MSTLDEERLLAWYGDDFTGSTDVLEAVSRSGLRSVLFLHQPGDATFARFKDCQAFGLAGSSRSETPEWMNEHLPPAFEWLRGLGARITHYKVCSTFDSSPRIGSIGWAIEIGKAVFDVPWVPVVVGAPSLRRYMVFGNLFAEVDGHTYRIDRHPTMSRHPVTPMDEADLRLHLAKQTSLRSALIDVLDLSASDLDRRVQTTITANPDVVFIDVMDDRTLAAAGRLLWDTALSQRFVAGSSGIEYSLIEWWRASGLLALRPADAVAEPVDRLLVVSGSCSPVTQRQIQHARQNGFAAIRLDARALADGGAETIVEAARKSACEALANGRSVCVYTSGGPEDGVDPGGHDRGKFARRLAEQTGRVLRFVLDCSRVERVVVAGGDTSSHAGRQLGIDALTFLASLAPGAPLCRAWSAAAVRDGLQIVFKGGQCGRDDFFSLARDGGR
jgi:uncharacterized protein YgbK (DUF1537 family)